MSVAEPHKTSGVYVEELDISNYSREKFGESDSSIVALKSRFSLYGDATVPDLLNSDDPQAVIHFLEQNEGQVWLDCQSASVDEITAICDTAFGGLHPLTVELFAEQQQCSNSLQELKSYLFATFGPENAVIIFGKGIISLSKGSNEFRSRIQRRLHQSLSFRSDWICYALVDEMTRQMLPAIHRMDQDSTWVNNHVYIDFDDADGKAVLDRLAETRREIVLLLMQLRSKLDIVDSLARHQSDEEVGHYFNDVKDSLLTMKYRLEAHESLLGNTHRNWMAVTQMKLEKTKSKILVVIAEFLALAAVFVPMITVFTAGHMNLDGPGMDDPSVTTLDRWGAIVGIVCGLAAIIVLGSYFFFRAIMRRPPPSLTGEPPRKAD